MRALTVTTESPHLTLSELPQPILQTGQSMVRVLAFSLNRGEVLDLPGRPPGWVPGWDIAGVVDQTTADGPPVGARVVGLVRSGAWAEYAAVPNNALATLADEVGFAEAATLPTAGVTALRALEVAGLLLSKRVLITGATGGVGRMAVQLASASGAEVTALVRDVTTAEPLASLGAKYVVDELRGDYDFVLDCAGGATFGAAIEHLAPRGLLVNIATPDADALVAFRAGRFDRSPGARVYTLNNFDEVAAVGGATRDLERLISLMAGGRLNGQVSYEDSWQRFGPAIDALLGRRIGGKVVLHVD